MRTLHWKLAGALAGLLAVVLLNSGPAQGEQILQQGFEARGPFWKPGSSDATSKVLVHKLTEETAHGGQRCEHLKMQIEKGSYIHYTLDVPPAPITDELNLNLWLKSNRPGIQLYCRVVLPREQDAKNVGQKRRILVKCEPYNNTRWKLINLRQPVKRLREQQQLLTHQLGREVVTTGAYIDQLILNVYGGPGTVDVWIDDLELGPVVDTPSKPVFSEPTSPTVTPGKLASVRRHSEVQLRGNQLWVNGNRYLMRGIRHTGTPLRTLRDAGFNTVWLDESSPNSIIEEAANLGFAIVPSMRPPKFTTSQDSRNIALEFHSKVSRFLAQDAVLCWDIGSNLTAERFADTSRLANTFRGIDPHRPVISDVWDGYRGFSRSLEQLLLGTHRWPLMTSMELDSYREWLAQRRRLSMDTYCWTWIQTHLPEWFVQQACDGNEREGFKDPIGPHPEQIRLLAYTALAAGYRGLAFWSDRFLADSYQGRDRLLAMALLNQELTMLERILVQATKEPDWISTSRPEVMAALFRTPDGILVLPIWVGLGAQFVPGQAATPELRVTVPGVPVTATAWEVTPGRMQALPMTRELGGNTVKLRNFSLTSAILFTSDLRPTGLVVRLQDMQRRMGRLAAQWLQDQAKEELAKVEIIQGRLEQLGRALPDSRDLIKHAKKAIDVCMQHRRNGQHTEAYGEAEVALRSLRLLMRAQWEKAIKDLDHPVSTPFAVSYYTLPKHWRMVDELRGLQPAKSVIPHGDFELPAEATQTGWLIQEVPSLDEVQVRVSRVNQGAHSGKQCLMMQVAPKDPIRAPAVLERTMVALSTPSVKLPPGTLVCVSVWIRCPGGVAGSPDGVLFFDSASGEPLGVRHTAPIPKWRRYRLYRRVPASGRIHATVALTGMGTVYVDDLAIEPLVSVGAAAR